jgi:hypothetical protein
MLMNLPVITHVKHRKSTFMNNLTHVENDVVESEVTLLVVSAISVGQLPQVFLLESLS